MKAYLFTTHQHVGDHVIVTGAVRNVVLEHPGMRFFKPHYYKTVFDGNPDFTDDPTHLVPVGNITYGPVSDEREGSRGNCVEGFTRVLCELIGIPQVPIRTRHPVLCLNDEEREYAKRWEDAVLVNANCQTCTVSKGYPWWQEVVDGLGGRIVQIGGREDRDLSPDLRGVEDMRGMTTLRQLFAMVYGCRMVLSPPSAVSNVAGAFQKPQVILNASREADALLAYDNAVHVSHVCQCGWGVRNGCVALWFDKSKRSCPYPVMHGGRRWSLCQYETKPEYVLCAISRLNALSNGAGSPINTNQ